MDNSAIVGERSTHAELEANSVDIPAMKQTRELSILGVDFDELFRRHLCRHSQFGINVMHLISVYGVYFSLLGLITTCIRSLQGESSISTQTVLTLSIMLPYILVLAVNIPLRILATTVFSLVILTSLAALAHMIPWPLHFVLILAWHQVQLLSHKQYTLERDMSEFRDRYRKGPRLFVLLLVYELPILLNYFMRRGEA